MILMVVGNGSSVRLDPKNQQRPAVNPSILVLTCEYRSETLPHYRHERDARASVTDDQPTEGLKPLVGYRSKLPLGDMFPQGHVAVMNNVGSQIRIFCGSDDMGKRSSSFV